MYPNAGAALIHAFNTTLFDSYKAAGWQRLASELCDKYPELNKAIPMDHCFDGSKLTRNDWATQAGMVSRLLRSKLSAEDFHILRARYTHDGNDLQGGAGKYDLRLTDNLKVALVEGWPYLQKALVETGKVRGTIVSNKVRFQYLALRALRPDVIESPVKAVGKEKQPTVNQQQYEVKKVVGVLVKSAVERAWDVLEEAQLVNED